MRTWTTLGTCQFSAGAPGRQRNTMVFDFDGTLVPYRSRGPEARMTLACLARYAADADLVIVSNRSGKDKLAPLQEYVAELDALIGAAVVTVYAATEHDRWRKPHTATWKHYCEQGRPPAATYYGDAAGRPGDFSNTDRLFAYNCGIEFSTESLLFYGRADNLPPLPRPLGRPGVAGPMPIPPTDRPVCLVMVGAPASGKSTHADRFATLLNAEVVGNDRQGARHKALFEKTLSVRRNVCVDNTNPMRTTRAEYLGAARSKGYSTCIIWVSTSREICCWLNAARCEMGVREKEVPPIALRTYWSRFEEPHSDEADMLITAEFRLAMDAPREVTEMQWPTSI